MRGAAFDPELEEEIGRAIAEEVLDVGANFFGGVCVNLPYHRDGDGRRKYMEKIRIFLAGWEVHWSAEYRRMA